MEDALSRAVKAAGGQNGLARALGVSQPSVWYWVNKSKRLPADHVLTVEAATGVSRYELRPDVFGSAVSNDVAAPVADPNTRIITCSVCDRRLDERTVRGCQALDCPRAEREAA